MKKRIASLICVLLIIMGLPATACASEITPRASEYFSYTAVQARAAGNGKVCVEIDINATHMMDEVGASYIYIYEQQSDGTYDVVYTFRMSSNSSMIVEDSFFAYLDIYYQGIPGHRYYAYVGCYAKDSNGAETLFFSTNSVVA